MGLDNYDVDKALVLDNYLPHYTVTGNTLPHADSIDADGHLLERTLSEVLEAMAKGGRGWAPTATSSENPGMYIAIQGAIAERCAIRYAKTLSLGDNDKLNTAWDKSDDLLANWATGDRIGDVGDVSTTSQRSTFKHGDTSITTIDNARFPWNGEM